jgi:hypothetical protein
LSILELHDLSAPTFSGDTCQPLPKRYPRTLLCSGRRFNRLCSAATTRHTRALSAPIESKRWRRRPRRLRSSRKGALHQLEGPARAALDKLSSEIASKTSDLADIQRRINASQQLLQARKQEHRARVQEASAKGQDAAGLNASWTTESTEIQRNSAELQRQQVELQTDIAQLQAQVQREQAQLTDATARARLANAPDAMVSAHLEMQSILDRAGLLEKEIAEGANVALGQATAQFRENTGDFSEAESHHRSQARLMFVAVFVLLAVSAVAVHWLFLSVSTPAEVGGPQVVGAEPNVASTSLLKQSQTILNIERIMIMATGRLAILLFLAWAVKYLADLHRAHSEQAIIYRDRRAALGVAELLLNATPELQQKREILKTLTEVYLDLERTAFVRKPQHEVASPESFDSQVKRMKEAVGVVEPILDAVGKVAKRG